MCENVDLSALLGGDRGGEDENLSVVVLLEQGELRVELEGLGVVEVDISCDAELAAGITQQEPRRDEPRAPPRPWAEDMLFRVEMEGC